MLRSMTGFGRCVMEDADWTQTWEVRSVNSRFLDLKWRLPLQARGLEARFERAARQCATRGRVEISLLLQQRGGGESNLLFDADRASAMLDALTELAEQRGESFDPDYNALLSVADLWRRETDETDEADETLAARLEDGLLAALDDWNEARTSEGAALARDMLARVLRLGEWVARLEERAPDIKEERFALLRERLSEALGPLGHEPDEGRLLQELVILADRLDVSEELTRLRAHLDRMRELLGSGSDAGRRLDFTLQECFREIATCGNKIQDSRLSRLVVDFKNELEKCREQVQNLE